METEGTQVTSKRMKLGKEKEREIGDGPITEPVGEETEGDPPVSEQMGLDIARILEKIDRFTQLVSQLLESGKSLFKQLSNDFEERMILIHKEQMEKWQEEIKELHLLDASNEEINALLHSARYMLQGVHSDS